MNEENPLVDLPTITDLPYYASGDAELQAQGYGNTPANNPNIALYQPSYKNNTRDMVESMRADMMSDLSFGGGKQDTLSSIINNSNKKIDISGGYVKANDAYETLSDGTLLPKYKMYKPGVNNEDYNASMQSSSDKFFNPVKRGITKVGRGIFADIGSFVYGVGEAAVTGRAESLFDNNMSNWVDDMDKRTDFNYKNYYTEAQNGLGLNMYTWDKVLGGAEFTARMLGAEAVIAVATGGTSLPASFARAGARIGLGVANNTSKLSRALRGLRGAEALEDIMEVGARAGRATRIMNEPIANVARQGGGMFSAERYQRGIESAISAGKLADNLKQARFAVTGSMYEAGFEARHYQKEAEDAFWEYHRAQGVEPTQEQVGDFYNKVDDTTWGVFGANMGILSVSNLALFGNMLNIKPMFPKSSIGSFLDRSVFKIGTQRGADGVWAPLKSNFFNKALAYSAPVAKGAFTEGVFEEGGQGIASGMMKNYMAATYDPKAMKETADYSSAFTKAFKDQYSTKEGIEEVVIGGIIGGLFGGGMGMMNTASKYKNQAFTAQVQNTMPQVADSIVSNLYTNENLSNIFGHSNRLQGINDRIENAKAKGDITGSALHSAESFISMLQASTSMGKSDEFMDVLKDSFRGMDSGKLAEGQNIKPEDVEAFKAEKIKGVERIAEDYSKAREAAGYIFGRGKIGGFYEVEGKKVNRQNLIDAFAYTSAMGGVSQQIASDSFNAFQQKLAQVGTDPSVVEEFGTMAALQTAGEMERLRYVSATTEETRLIKQRKKLEDQILRLQKSEMTPEITQKLENLADDLQNLGAEITTASQNKDLYWRSIADNFYDKLGTQGYLPQIEFDSFNKKTGVLQDFLNRSSLAEYDKVELNKLLDEFSKANDISKSFGKLASNLSDPNFTFKTYNNIFSGLRAKSDSSLNEATREALLDLYNTDTKVQATMTEFQLRPSLSTDDVVKSIREDESFQVPADVIAEVANKVKNNNALSENEKVVYEKNKETIDDSINQIRVDPINTESEDAEISNTTVQINANKAEIKELKKGNLTPEIQAEIDRIQAEIDNLKSQVSIVEVQIDVNVSEVEAQRQTELDRINYQGFTSNTKDLSEEERQKLKDDIKAKIEALPDDQVYLVHQTAEDTASDLFKNGFRLQGSAIESTFLMMSKATMIETFSNLIDGNTYHRGSTGAFIYALPKSFYGNSKITAGNAFDSMVENIDGFMGVDMPTQYNVGYFNNGVFGTETEAEINAKYDAMLDQKSSESTEVLELRSEVATLDGEIEALEKEIEFLEESGKVEPTKVRDITETRKYNYKQYEYTKKNGDVVMGWIELRNDGKKTFFVTNDESIYLGESENTVITSLPNLTEMSEENIIVEGNEIYANDKLYKTEDLDSAITQDSEGNYEVTLKARNGRPVTFTGSIADAIVYEHTLNKFLEQATDEQIGEAERLAEQEAKIERKYEELITKTEDRASKKTDISAVLEIEGEKRAEELDRIASVNEEISTLENSKDFIVSDRITDLETENEELKSKESADKKLQKKKDSLANRISTLRAEILNDIARNSWNIDIDVENISMDRSSSVYPKIKKLRKLESDLKNLNKIKEEFNPNASYSEQLDWVVKNSNVLEYETVDEITTASPPSQEEIDRYSELDSKKRKTKKDKEEIAELREKILPHKLVEGSFFGGIPLIDIIQVNNQSKEVKDVENTQIERLLQEDVQAAIAMVQNQDQTPEFRASNVALVYDGVFMKGGSAVQGIFHVKLGTMLNAGLANNLDMTVSEFTTDKDGKVEYSEPSTVDGLNINEISSKYDNFNGVRFTIGDEIVMEKSETGTNFNVTGDLAGLMGLTPYAITGQPTSYVLLYEQKSDGTLAPKESEYEVTRDGNVIPFDKETLNKIKPGDEVTLFYDETDDYNKKLKKSDRAKKGNIYVMKNGNLVNILKADTEYRTNTEGWAELSDLRKKVFENKTVKVKVKNSYLGLPIIHIGSDGRAIEQEIKEDIVQSYGYLDSTGEYHFFDNTTVDNSQYTDPYKQMGKNIPVVAFKYNDRVYTFPVQVYAEGIDAQSELDDILNDQTSNEYQKMFKTNMLLDKYNLKTDEMQWTNQNDSLEAIRTALSSIQGKIDITSKDSVEKARKTILLNMNDPFMSSKLVLDIKESTETLNESNTKTKGDVTIEPSTSIGEDLSNENKC